MSCAMIRGYAEGWGRFQGRVHGKPREDSHDDIPDIAPEDQQLLSGFAIERIPPPHA